MADVCGATPLGQSRRTQTGAAAWLRKPTALSTENSRRKDLVSTNGLQFFDQLVTELGGDPAPLLEDAGIDSDILSQPNKSVAFSAVASLLENTAQALNCPDFGMRFADRQDLIAVMSPLDKLVCNAPTLGKATLSGINHMAVYSPAIRETLEFDCVKGLFRLRYEARLSELGLTPQMTERTLLLVCNANLFLTGGKVGTREVWFTHPAASPSLAYRKRFGATVRFSQEHDGLFFTGEDLRQSVVGSDLETYRHQRKVVETEFAWVNDDFEMLVRDFLRDNLHASATRQHLAEHLGLSTRTLHRRLSAAGWTFETIRDDVRRTLAIHYLGRKALSLTETAAMLGYSELAVFSRSCQRWFCTTPGNLRRGLTSRQYAFP